MFNSTKHLKSVLIAALVMLLAVTLLGACQTTEKKYDHLVTFDYNVGDKFKADNGLSDRDVCSFIGVLDGSLVGLKPGDRTDFPSMSFTGYYCDNKWYLPQLDDDGKPVKDEDGIVKLGEEWDFANDKVTSNITLYANLTVKVAMNFVDVDTGKIVKTLSDDPGKVRNRPAATSTRQPSKDNATFYEYYVDKDCTQVFGWPYTYGTEDVMVYVKFIPGYWNIVKTADEFTNALKTGGNIYVDANIDFAGKTWSVKDILNVTINGNGHTLSNIAITHTFDKNNPHDCALFGTLGANANVYDLAFGNVSITAEATVYDSDPYRLAMFACAAEEGAQVTNVSVGGTIVCSYKFIAEPKYSNWIVDNKSSSAAAPANIGSTVTVTMTEIQ